MTILDVYQHYQIMPNLQLHMLRVGAVAKLICQNMKNPVEEKEIVTACMLHDMGNIIKFDLTLYPEFLYPEGLDYWQHVQQQYFEKFGKDEHHATAQIIQEVGVSPRVQDIAGAVGFSKTQENYQGIDMAKKIAEYGDDRVTPLGVVPLEERILDLETRYGALYPSAEAQKRRMEFALYVREIEKQIFAECNIRPDQINDKAVAPIIEELKTWDIATGVLETEVKVDAQPKVAPAETAVQEAQPPVEGAAPAVSAPAVEPALATVPVESETPSALPPDLPPLPEPKTVTIDPIESPQQNS